jgi:SpoIID/LytB domain protein
VPFDPSVRRWFAAVRRTSGEVLLYGDRPADTVYFSTSNGQTYGNDEVFGSAPLPYLRPVVERDDGASPVSHWNVRVPFDDLASFLHEAGEWPPNRTISSVGLAGSTVTVQGRERVALDGPDHVPRRRQRLGTMPEARSLPAVPAPGDAPVASG